MDAYSPKSSPRGSVTSNPMETGSNPLKLSIALGPGGQKPTIIQKGPFYLMKPESLPRSEITGATNLMASKGLEHSYIKLTTKKMKDSLSSFLPNLPGVIDTPGSQDSSSLRGLIEKPPVVGKELHQLSYVQMAGFRLHPGPLPEQYRFSMQVPTKKKQKKKKNKEHRQRGNETPAHEEIGGRSGGGIGSGGTSDDYDKKERREKKHKKHDKERSEERRKQKKEKKKKRNKEDKDP